MSAEIEPQISNHPVDEQNNSFEAAMITEADNTSNHDASTIHQIGTGSVPRIQGLKGNGNPLKATGELNGRKITVIGTESDPIT